MPSEPPRRWRLGEVLTWLVDVVACPLVCYLEGRFMFLRSLEGGLIRCALCLKNKVAATNAELVVLTFAWVRAFRSWLRKQKLRTQPWLASIFPILKDEARRSSLDHKPFRRIQVYQQAKDIGYPPRSQ